MDPFWSALIAATAGGVGSWFTFLAQRNTSVDARIKALEDRFEALSAKHKLLWLYCQDLIVHINEHKGPPAPHWPDGLNRLPGD